MMNVLVIEDNLFDFCLLDEMLKKSGDSDVRLAHRYSLADGFQALAQDPFDLILLDLDLPGSSGLDTFAAVSRHSPHIPIIVVSAMDSAEVALQAVKSGAQDYLVKGKINTDLLVRAMRYALERKRLTEELRGSQERYRIVSDLITDYAWSLRIGSGKQLDLEWITGSFHKLTGFNIEDIPAQTGWKKLVHPQDLAELTAHMRQVSAGQPGVIEFRIKAQDASYRWLRHYSRPVLEPQTGKLAWVYGAGKDITERKEMELKLREADDRYHSIFDGVNDAILVQSRAGRILDVNRSACKLYGYSREQLLSKHISEIVPDEYAHMLAADTAELKAKVPPHPIEFTNLRANGERFPVEMNISAYPIGSETVSLVVVRDISQRKQAEEAYRALVDRSLQELYIVQDGRIVFANQAAIRSTGYSLEELQGFLPEEILYGSPLEEGGRVFVPPEQRNAGHPTPSRQEFRRLRKDGTTGWASTLTTTVQFEGRPAIQIALVDVSERKQAEEAYRALVEQSLQELLIFQEGRVVFANPAAVSNSGYSLQELVSFSAEDLHRAIIAPEDLELFEEGLAQLLSGERSSILQEIRINSKAGKIRWVEALSICTDYQGKPSIQTVQFDVTERKRAEERLQYRHAIEALITSISTRFINLTSNRIDAGIQSALQSLGKFAGADRAFVYLLSSDWNRIEEAYEWCGEGVESRTDRLPGTSFEPFQWTLMKFKNRETVMFTEPGDLPEEAETERRLGESASVQSSLSFPLVLNNMLFGFWGFETTHRRKTWEDEDVGLLRIMGDVFVNALARQQTDQVLRRARQELDQIINSVSDALWTAEVDRETGQGEYRYISPVIERITGRPPEYFRQTPRPFLTLVPIEDRDWTRERLDRAWKWSSGPVVEEYRILLPDGQVRWVRDSRVASEIAPGRVRLDAVLSDITERKQAEQQLRHRLEIEEMVTNLSAGFINLSSEEVDRSIQEALQEIGEFTQVDHCFLDLISPDGRRIERSYVWASEGSNPAIGDNRGLELEPFHWSFERLRRQEVVKVPRVEDLPPAANFEKTFWLAQGRRSVLNIPLVLDEVLFGAFGFANERAEKEWAEEDIRLLQLMGDVFANVLARKKAEETLIEREAQYRLLAELDLGRGVAAQHAGRFRLCQSFSPTALGQTVR